MNLNTVRRYATGKAPYLAIPVWSLEHNRYIPATFNRAHLQAAISCPHLTHAQYDETAHRLILNGTPRARYSLVNLSTTVPQHEISDANRAWAQSQRKRKVTMATTPELRKAAKWREEVGKLERRVAKMHIYMPRSPLASRLYTEGNYWREMSLNYYRQKPMRRALGWLAHRPRTTWAAFYQEVARIVGRDVASIQRHDRVCSRKGGPTVVEYLNHLHTFIGGMAQRPYRRHVLEPDAFTRHRTAQIEYLVEARCVTELRDLISQHRVIIAELEQVTPDILPGELSEV